MKEPELLLPKKIEALPLLRKKESKPRTPYEKGHSLEYLDLLVSIVPNGQAGAIIDLMVKGEASASFISHGKGTASSDFYDVLGLGENQKQIVFSLIKERRWPGIKAALAQRFSVSEWSRGVAFAVRLDSLCGVSVYKILTNDRGIEPKGVSAMEAEIIKRDSYEMVMVIVNDGFTDLVMTAARSAGARGGTVLTARGTGNKEIEKFFGVVITPEKQIVIILVPKHIKDAVIEAIYKEVGINTKGQGICFSVPCRDVCGIVEDSTTQDSGASPASAEEPKD
jgi:nitrogen regulatory protein PII